MVAWFYGTVANPKFHSFFNGESLKFMSIVPLSRLNCLDFLVLSTNLNPKMYKNQNITFLLFCIVYMESFLSWEL